MPKKFQGQNTKAVEARQHEAERKKKNEEDKERTGQEEEWMETDKRVLRQQERLRLRETKRDALATRRAQNKTLLLSEEASSSSGKNKKQQQNETVQPRIVKQIPQRLPPLINPLKVDEKIQNQREEKRKQVPLNLVEIADEDLPSENINHIIRAQREEALGKILVDASSIEEALEQLQASEEEGLPTRPVDQHPERRSRTAYIAYEEAHLPDVRREYPSLKYSQHRMIMWKEWQKAPENPLNQQS